MTAPADGEKRKGSPRFKRKKTDGRLEPKELSLRELGYVQAGREELRTLLYELFQGPDRYVAIIAATLVESSLDELLLDHLEITDKKIISSLYERDAPLSSFFGKVKLGHALNLFDEAKRDNLDCIRRIRNAFAHARLNIGFTTSQVATECAKLKIDLPLPHSDPNPSRMHARELYILYCLALIFHFGSKSRDSLKQKRTRLKRQLRQQKTRTADLEKRLSLRTKT